MLAGSTVYSPRTHTQVVINQKETQCSLVTPPGRGQTEGQGGLRSIHECTKKWLSYQQMALRKQPLFRFVTSRAGEGRSETVDALDSEHVLMLPFPKEHSMEI